MEQKEDEVQVEEKLVVEDEEQMKEDMEDMQENKKTEQKNQISRDSASGSVAAVQIARTAMKIDRVLCGERRVNHHQYMNRPR